MTNKTATKEISILYADFIGFTALARIFQPEDMMAFLNRLFAVMEAPIEENGGVIDKIIGDGIVVTFNAFQPCDHHPEKAVKTALGIIKAVNLFARDEEQAIAIGIGIASGKVSCGPLGTPRHHPNTVIGLPVGRAVKLGERASREKETTLLVDSSVFHETISAFEYQQIDEDTFKIQVPIVQ
ncbi:adenylate/guanylate cyclase domain-containing protein [bacterium]|nr:adenylate/guanylate cyclase domain-containing protein [bacterium]